MPVPKSCSPTISGRRLRVAIKAFDEVSSGGVLVIAAFPVGPATTQAGPCVHSVLQGGFA